MVCLNFEVNIEFSFDFYLGQEFAESRLLTVLVGAVRKEGIGGTATVVADISARLGGCSLDLQVKEALAGVRGKAADVDLVCQALVLSPAPAEKGRGGI